jgi:aminopeptidase-like protein
MYNLLKQLSTLRLGPVTPDTDVSIKILADELPGSVVFEYDSGATHNGWVVPDNWYPKKAEIWKGSELVYDGMANPLRVIGYSDSFSGVIGLEELTQHIFTHGNRPDAEVYHCDLYYKTGLNNWGFTASQNWLNILEPGEYRVELETVREPGTMKVLEYTLPGGTDDVIVLNAHNCHAGQSNDDISGIVVGVELLRRLSKLHPRRYTYRLVIAPEHFGTVFYLASHNQQQIDNYVGGLFLETVGNDNRLAMQSSFTGTSKMDQACELALRDTEPNFERFGFRGLIGNDETVWEAPGYEVPMPQLVRFPYPEYHSNLDTPECIVPAKLEETVERVLSIIDILERDVVMHRKFTGLIALSAPEYDLYVNPGTDPSITGASEDNAAEWYKLMTDLPRMFDGKTTVADLCLKYNLPFQQIRDYVQKFADKELVELEPVSMRNSAQN